MLDPSLEDVVLKTPPESKKPVSAVEAISAQKKVVLKRKLIAPVDDDSVVSSTPIVGSPKVDAAAAAAVAAVTLNTSATSIKDADLTGGATPTKVPKIPITAPSDDDGIVIKNRAAEAAAKAADNGNGDAAAVGKDVVKLAEVTVLTYQERMELRAKRFGIPAAAAATTPPAAEKKTAAVTGVTAAAATNTKPSAAVALLADTEQLKKRAERFGLTVADESAKLAARAERFGTAATTTKTTVPAAAGAAKTTTSSNTSAELVEQMRKRAERFGGSVSKVMLQIENEEKLRERQDRFNATAAAAAAATTTVTTAAAVATVVAPAAKVPIEAPAAVADKTE